ncbi:MAG: SH3 domain-containing protein [Nocardioides sp.]|nr:SH3 domain-containing protein [Nocardioides sp.]
MKSIGRRRAPGRHTAPRPRRTLGTVRRNPVLSSSRLAVVAAPLATLAVIGAGLGVSALSDDAPASQVVAFDPTAGAGALGAALEREVRAEAVSRSQAREPLPKKKAPKRTAATVDTEKRWTTVNLNVWTGPGEDTRLVTVLDAGDRLRVTGVEKGVWAEIVHDDALRFVKAAYLVAERPQPVEEEVEEEPVVEEPAISGAPCPHGSSVEDGLGSNARGVYRAVCAAFPDISSYGGYRADGMHAEGRALDVMVSGDSGWQVAEWARANAGDLGISEVIFSQKIWTVERSSEGWRSMEDRGSTTANHYDHVHVTTY